jgi:hypothetical protein
MKTSVQPKMVHYQIAKLLVPVKSQDLEKVAEIIAALTPAQVSRLWKMSRLPGSPMMAQRDKTDPKVDPNRAKKILIDGLKYHEHDGHDMPKRVARNALAALGVKEDDQP